MKFPLLAGLLALLSTLNPQLSTASPGTAFTYQGRLSSGTNAANGSFDLKFSLYDAVSGPAQVGSSLTNLATAVTNGIFTVTLDFGSVFDGNARWLQIEVRTNGGGAFIPLSPRQPLTPSPYAIMAGSASNLLGTLPAAQLSGVLLNNLLAGTYSQVLTFNNAANNFSGNGSGLTSLNASQLASGTVPDGRLAPNVARTSQVWLLGGNAGTTPGTHFLGTTDNQPLEMKINGNRVLRLEQGVSSPNFIGGHAGNYLADGLSGAVLLGGGTASDTNKVLASFGVSLWVASATQPAGTAPP